MKKSDYVWVKAMADLMGVSMGRLFRKGIGELAYNFNALSDKEKIKYVDDLHKND